MFRRRVLSRRVTQGLGGVGLLGVLLLGCGDSESAAGPPPPLSRLWRTEAPDQVEALFEAEVSEELIFRTLFRGGGGNDWWRVDKKGENLMYRPWKPSGGSLRLSNEDGYGVVTVLPARPGDAFTVRVRGQITGSPPTGAVPIATVVELSQPFDAASTMTPEEVVNLFDSRRHASYVLQATPGWKGGDLEVSFAVDEHTSEVAVYLLSPFTEDEGERVFQGLQVSRYGAAQHLAEGGEMPRLWRLDPPSWGDVVSSRGTGPVRVRLDRDERQGLLCAEPCRYEWVLPPWPRERRLDFSLGLAVRHPEIVGAARCQVRAGEQILFDEVMRPPQGSSEDAWSDYSVLLPAHPEGSLPLSFTITSEGGELPVTVIGHPTLRTPQKEAPPNVVLISLDTLRPDVLGAYGQSPSPSPRLDRLASEGLLFTRAYSTSSYTLPSHGSMLTGQYPAFHGAVDVDDKLTPERSPFLAGILAEAGYVTAAFTGGGYVSSGYGFGEGFDRYSLNDPVWAYDAVRGEQLLQTMGWEREFVQMDQLERYGTDRITNWISSQDDETPFFVFLHTYIVHNYAVSRAYQETFDLFDKKGKERPFHHVDRRRFNEGEGEYLESVREDYMAFYLATVAMADAFVGNVLDSLEQAGLAENTLVVVTSDHGEEFGEHGFFGHGTSLYDATTRIPLIARLPKSEAHSVATPEGSTFDDPVSLVDLAPWILRLVDLDPDPRMAVVPPLGPDQENPPARSLLFLELDTHVSRMSAVLLDDIKLHVQIGKDGKPIEPERRSLFNLANDPQETKDVLASHGEEEGLLRQRLGHLHQLGEAIVPRDDGEVDLSKVDPALLQQLKQLGYLDG